MAEKALSLLLENNSKGGKILLKDPRFSTHPSWHLWLPSHFNTSLGLRFVQRQETKNKQVARKWKEWAQVSSFCFTEGAILYDRDVTSLETWGDKLDAIDFFVEIGPTRPVSFRSSSSLESTLDEGLSRDPGSVHLKIYVPTSDHGIVIAHEHTVTQDQFVRYAISVNL